MRFQTKGVRISEGLDYCTVVVGLCVCVCVCGCARACVCVGVWVGVWVYIFPNQVLHQVLTRSFFMYIRLSPGHHMTAHRPVGRSPVHKATPSSITITPNEMSVLHQQQKAAMQVEITMVENA